MPIVLLVMMVIPILGLARPELARTRGGDPLVNRAGYALFLAFILAAFAASCVPLILGQWAKFETTKGNTRTIQGCVANFERVVHPNAHNVADTYFSLNGVDFHFNSSPWLPGFHNEGNQIAPGQALSITMAGKTVLRIEPDQRVCAAQR